MRLYGERGVEGQDDVFGDEGLGHAFVLFLEEELSVEVGDLGRGKGTSMVSMSRMWMAPMPILHTTFRI